MFRLECNLYDNLELLSMRATKVIISFVNSLGEVEEIEGKISDIYSKDGIERIIVNGEIEIKTEDLLSVNGLEFKG